MKKQTKPERRQQKPANAVPKETPSPQADDSRSAGRPFPIVGIGASAGGLEALELFLRNVPEDSGMAFVIVQHLDPTHKGIMVKLLQRATAMQVIQVKDRTRIQPDCVYVIPPNKDMSILHGVLHLLDPVAPRGLRLPIDFFFRSLADDWEERSIGVILSGMGTDGTMGLKAIKEKAGVVFVQEPASAKFDSMPRSATDAGLADVVAPVEELPEKIIAYLQHAPLIAKPGLTQEDKAQSAMEKVAILLRAHTGHDFSLYKKSTVYRRIERRMGIHQIDKIAMYVRFLRGNPQELELLFKELLIGVTNFFRDPAEWEQLKREVIPALLAGRSPSQALRAWVPGCATGEEAYSLAIVFKEALEQLKPAKNFTLQIFATDLDRDAIEKAREGVFRANIAADVSPERLSRFFVQGKRGYQISKTIREMVVFAPQNVIMDPPFTKLDILSCRNLLIYLTPELQKKLLPLFHHSLNPGGILFLGSAESIGTFADLFALLDGKARLYRRLESALWAEPVEFPASFVPALTRAPSQPKALKPAAMLVNDKGDTLLAQVEQELQQCREELETTCEEMQNSQEELKSTNEELQSANEEFQSTNEELTTSKEEMQSLNEELRTLNDELQVKLDELSRMNNDMKNLLNSTEIITLFLDNALHVRLFTTGSNRVFKLIPSDVGRPITDIASDLLYPELAEDARKVLRTLVCHEKLVAARDGRWFVVRIMPYHTLENMIDGVVITFMGITVPRRWRRSCGRREADLGKRIAEQAGELDTAGKRSQAERQHGQSEKGA